MNACNLAVESINYYAISSANLNFCSLPVFVGQGHLLSTILLILAEVSKLEYDEADAAQDSIHRQIGYRPEGRIPDLEAVRDTTRLDNDNMDYKRPTKEGMVC